jgi:hypothetical protein
MGHYVNYIGYIALEERKENSHLFLIRNVDIDLCLVSNPGICFKKFKWEKTTCLLGKTETVDLKLYEMF